MREPTLIIMAAGMGSRYGGLKQIDPIDEQGHVIIDYSLYDARRAGFKNVIFITKESDLDSFKSKIADPMQDFFDVKVVLQSLDNLPEGYSVPEGRTKPWGTGHALYSCYDVVDGPVAVINADDYYGVSAYKLVYDYLVSHQNNDGAYTMVGYLLKNTVTENGYVSRGICDIKDGILSGITERTRIEKRNNEIEFSEDAGESWESLSGDSVVSMNMWGFSQGIMDELKNQFPVFLEENLSQNPLKCEFFLPFVVNNAINNNRAQVEVLTSHDKWYGVTYKEDKPNVVKAIDKMKNDGLYPTFLWK